MKQEIVKLEIPCSPEYVSVPRTTAEVIARRLAFSDEKVQDVKLAVGEACSNAVKFSSPGKPAVRVFYRMQPDCLEIEVHNTGKAFNAESREKRLPSAEQLCEGGLGLYLIGQVMDDLSIRFSDGATIVKMVMNMTG